MSKKMVTVAKNVRKFVMSNSPTILTGLGVAGVVTTTVMGIQATPKAMEIIKEAKQQRFIKAVANQDEEYDLNEKLTKQEIIKLTWKCYVPTTLMALLSIGCIIGSNKINLRRNAALASMYSISEAALKEFQNKVVEQVGPEKLKEIKDEISKDAVKNHPVNDEEIINTGNGDTLCYDALCGRYFKSDIEFIKRAINEIGATMLRNDEVTLNEVYYAMDLKETELGEYLSFHIDDGLLEGDFSSALTDTNVPCLVMSFKTRPRYEY